jgi:hypothetical protein
LASRVLFCTVLGGSASPILTNGELPGRREIPPTTEDDVAKTLHVKASRATGIALASLIHHLEALARFTLMVEDDTHVFCRVFPSTAWRSLTNSIPDVTVRYNNILRLSDDHQGQQWRFIWKICQEQSRSRQANSPFARNPETDNDHEKKLRRF